MIPSYFGLKVIQVTDSRAEANVLNFTGEAYFQIGLSDFGEGSVFKLYGLVLALFEALFPIMSLSIMNIISICKFKKIMREKRRKSEANVLTAGERSRIDRAEIKFTILIIALTFIQIFCRIFDITAAIFRRLKYVGNANINLSDSLIAVLSELSVFLMLSAHSFDGILYFFFCTQLKKALLRLFGRRFV